MSNPSTLPQQPAIDLSRLSQQERQQVETLLKERAQRQLESLNLWEPLPEQDRFHRSIASERVVIGGWQSGKSATCAEETVRAALHRDPFNKYPTNRPLTIWIVAWEEGNIGRTIHRLLFRAGAFKIIPDLVTGKWRAYRPWEDSAREAESKPAPPLIPPRYISDWAWKDKARRIFSICRLTNGTEIFTFSSGGDPPTGDWTDLIWIDEDLQYGEHLHELEARLSYVKGKLIWSARPRSRNEALMGLCDSARSQLAWDQPDVQAFQLAFTQNPHMSEDEKRKRLNRWTPEERSAFDYGEFTNATVLFYPNFSIEIQGIPQNADPYGVPLPDQDHEIDRLLCRKVIPPDWTRYMVVDPGQTVCFVLFAAVPPTYLGDCVVCYQELYLQNCDPVKFGKMVSGAAGDQSFYAFIIDEHGARQRAAGVIGSLTVRQQYSSELRRHGIRAELTGHSFLAGNDDIAGGTNLVKSWLNIRDDGSPRLRILRGTCPHLESSLSRYRKKIINGVVTDQPARGDNHGADAARYLVCYKPKWHKTRPPEKRASAQYLAMKQLGDDIKKRRSSQGILLGPCRN